MATETNVSHSVSSFDPSDFQRKRKRPRGKTASSDVEKQKKPAFTRIIQLCSTRDRSSQELTDRLMRDGYSSSEALEAINRSIQCGLVDDARFAEAFIRTKVAAGKGKRNIEFELKKHCINVDSIEGWPEDFGLGDEDQLDKAIEFLMSHPPSCKDKWAGAYRKLIQKGYSNSIASQAVRSWSSEC